MVQMRFEVTGMVCGGCAEAVERVVSGVSGVGGVEVSHEGGTAVVVHDGSADAEAVYAAVRAAGFDVKA